jgi:hypothetical protein
MLTAASRRRSAVRKSAGFPERVAKQEFDLPVEASEVVIRPALQCLEQHRVDPEEERFTFSHGVTRQRVATGSRQRVSTPAANCLPAR